MRVIDILSVLIIILISFALLCAANENVVNDARAVSCQARLQKTADATIRFLHANNDMLFPGYEPKRKEIWNRRLRNDGFLEDMDVVVCPDFAPVNFRTSMLTYGMDTVRKKDLCVRNENNKVPMHADSYGIIGDKPLQIYRLDGGNMVHLRHQGTANLSFADGSVSAYAADELDGFKNNHRGFSKYIR